METRNKVIITFLALIAIIAIFYNSTQWVTKTTGYAIGEDEKTLLAQCLTGKGAVLYVLPNSEPCINQKNIFGSAFIQLNYLDCTNNPLCPKLTVFPSWEINGTIFQGNKSLEELKNISNCN